MGKHSYEFPWSHLSDIDFRFCGCMIFSEEEETYKKEKKKKKVFF